MVIVMTYARESEDASFVLFINITIMKYTNSVLVYLKKIMQFYSLFWKIDITSVVLELKRRCILGSVHRSERNIDF